MDILTADEVSALIARCSRKAPTGIRNRAIIVLLYRSGLRVAELTAVRMVDVDLDRRTITVQHGKGDRRTVRRYHESADDALHRWIDKRRELGLARQGVPLFCTLQGGRLSTNYARDLLKRLAREAGIEKRVHPHGLRHTFAVDWLNGGANVGQISELLGHKNVAVTSVYLDHLASYRTAEIMQTVVLEPLKET